MEPAFNTIHCMNCIEGLQALGAETVDLAFADPPFNIGYQYDVYHDKKDYQTYLDWSRQWMEAVCRVLTPNGTFWVAIGDEFAAELKTIAQKELHLTCRSWVVWYYTFGVNCTKKFNRSHVHLFHLVKNRKKFTFNAKTIRIPSARQTVYADGRAQPGGKLPDDTWILRPQDADGFVSDQDTWYFPRVAGTFKERAGFHGCQMPEQLLGRIIRLCSNPGDLVVDPFAGSGTTITVAKKLGRRWIGFDISEAYVQKALQRANKAYAGEPLAGAPEPLVSAPRTPKRSPFLEEPPPYPGPSHALFNEGEAKPEDTERAIIAAYLASSHGFSTDRVICDPELNEAFLNQCRRYGIGGEPVSWNRLLLRLRKAAKLASLPASRRTRFSREDLDSYLFASEIAIRTMLDKGSVSLDDILSDPTQAKEFDQVAQRFAPGFSSLQYRWAALRIRKQASDIRNDRTHLPVDALRKRLPRFQPMVNLKTDQIQSVPGIYLLRTGSRRFLYAGGTSNLQSRIKTKLEAFQPWQELASDIQIVAMPLAEEASSYEALQSNLIKEYEPDLNYLELGVA